IPDGNRRWALQKGLNKEDGHERGISPGMSLFHTCQKLGIKEMSFYGFTADNTKRPSVQRLAFTKACVAAVKVLSEWKRLRRRASVFPSTSTHMWPEARCW
ncbi:undecaprenyl diphosphate synthase family protein, partial [[Clostridium] symbiosum]|uniref:undecaprenyl diphosphate synthase family protein n=1 Tax=Clostridium symbiosum TaxID=1512 RepID=UPI00210CBAA8